MEAKDKIREYLRATPGASTQMVGDGVGLDPSTADYHLRRMLRAGQATREQSGREAAWFLVGCGLCPILRASVPALRRPNVGAVARELREDPDTATSLAARAGEDVGRTRWAAESLMALGLAERTRTGRIQRAPGAEICIAKALRGEACDQWGKCLPSRTMPMPAPKAR